MSAQKRITRGEIAGACRRWGIPEDHWPAPGELTAGDLPPLPTRPNIALADLPLCEHRPFEHLSGCLRGDGHQGACIVAGLKQDGANFYRATTTPEPIYSKALRYWNPMRLELAEEWAIHEAFGMTMEEYRALNDPVGRALGRAA